MKLFEIGAQFDALDALMVETGGEVTPEIEAWLVEYGNLEAEKIDGFAMYIRSKEHEAEGFKKVAGEFTAKQRAAENVAKRLREYLKQYMEVWNIPQIKGKLYTAAIQKNGGKAPLILESERPEDFPEALRVVTVSLNNEKVRDWLSGEGPSIPAHLGEIGTNVRIR